MIFFVWACHLRHLTVYQDLIVVLGEDVGLSAASPHLGSPKGLGVRLGSGLSASIPHAESSASLNREKIVLRLPRLKNVFICRARWLFWSPGKDRGSLTHRDAYPECFRGEQTED